MTICLVDGGSPLARNTRDDSLLYKLWSFRNLFPRHNPIPLRPRETGRPCSSPTDRPWLIGVSSPDMQFLTRMYSVEITSDECLSVVQSLLNCPLNMALVRSFRGSDALVFIDFLDQASEPHSPPPYSSSYQT